MKPSDKIKKHYNPRLKQYQETHQILDWESREAQVARFEVLINQVDLSGRSVLDVGCGCGDLFGLLSEKGIDVDYTGVDILPGMIEKAQSLHDGGRFICGDLFGDGSICQDVFDVVFTSGIFNLNLGNNGAFFDAALPVLDNHAGEVLVVNLLHHESPGRDDRYFYFDPAAVKTRLEKMGRRVELIDDYLQNDFTVLAWK